ncbi:MAG: TetR/AcrR family transcriptional regulator, partial [Bacteroidota bacterium]
IIKATLELTHERGLAGIKMSTLAKRAGIATGSLYTYFEDKQDLLLSVNQHVRQMGVGYLLQRLDPRLNLPDRLLSLIESFADYIGDNREAIVFADLLKRSPYMTEAAAQEAMEQYAFLFQLLQEGQASGEIRPGDPEELLHIIYGVLKSLIDFQRLKGLPYGPNVRNACRENVWRILQP